MTSAGMEQQLLRRDHERSRGTGAVAVNQLFFTAWGGGGGADN